MTLNPKSSCPKDMDKKIYFIGGTPCSGKSYLANTLSQKLKIPWISTDIIRGLMKNTVRKENNPKLFMHSGATAASYLTTHTPEEIVKNQNLESEGVWEGILKLIESNYEWKSYIIEGVAILPKQVKELMAKNPTFQAVFIIEEDWKRLDEVLYNRGLWDDADKYPDSVKEIEFQWLIKFNEWLKEETQKYGLTLIKVGKREDVLPETLKAFGISE